MNEEKPKTSKSIKKTQPTNLKRNPWKIAFLVLVGLVIGSVAFVTFRATQVREPDLKKIPAIVEKEGEPVVTIQSKKQQVNKLIDFYLADFQKGSEIKYKFYLENDALLNGSNSSCWIFIFCIGYRYFFGNIRITSCFYDRDAVIYSLVYVMG